MAQSRPQWLADLSRSFKRHRHGRPGWSIEVNRERLRVVSSELPPRPGEQPTEAPIRRAFTLRTPPGPQTAAAALREACEVFDAVMEGRWCWPDPTEINDGESLHTAALEKVIERLRCELVGERMQSVTWERSWRPFLLKLLDTVGENQGQDPEQLLTQYLKRWPAGSKSRQYAHDRARAVWKLAGLSWPESITTMRGNGRGAVDPAGVRAFSDAEITMLRERIQASARLTPSDLLAWDLLIVFGLRPAELQGLELARVDGELVATVTRVKESGRGRCGPREIPAVPPAGWPPDCFQLLKRWHTHGLSTAISSARSPGQILTQQLRRLHMPSDLSSYGLRHGFALRLGVELGIHVREAAELMGHSPQVHLSTYGRRLDQPALLAKVQRLTAGRYIGENDQTRDDRESQ
jgi:integrase